MGFILKEITVYSVCSEQLSSDSLFESEFLFHFVNQSVHWAISRSLSSLLEGFNIFCDCTRAFNGWFFQCSFGKEGWHSGHLIWFLDMLYSVENIFLYCKKLVWPHKIFRKPFQLFDTFNWFQALFICLYVSLSSTRRCISLTNENCGMQEVSILFIAISFPICVALRKRRLYEYDVDGLPAEVTIWKRCRNIPRYFSRFNIFLFLISWNAIFEVSGFKASASSSITTWSGRSGVVNMCCTVISDMCVILCNPLAICRTLTFTRITFWACSMYCIEFPFQNTCVNAWNFGNQPFVWE